MAESKRLEGKDLIAPKFLTDSITEAEKFLHVIKEIKTVVIETNKVTAKTLKNSKGTSSKDIKQQNQLMADSNEQRAAAIELEAKEIAALNKLNKAKADAANFDKKQADSLEKQRKAQERANSEYAKASKKLNDLRNHYKDLAVSGKAGEQATKNLLLQIQKLDTELKEVDASVGQFNREVGNYKEKMKEAIEETGLMSAGMNKLDAQSAAIVAGFGNVVNQLKKVKEAQAAATSGAKKFGLALKASGIALVIAALASLFAYFTSSREGALEFDLILARLQGTIDGFVRGLKNYGKGILLLFKAIGSAVTGDFAKAQEQMAESNEMLGTAFDGTTDVIDKQIDAYKALAIAIAKAEDEVYKLQITRERANMNEEDFNEIAADVTISLNRQKEALNSAAKERRIAAEANVAMANIELDIEKQKLIANLRRNGVSEQELALIQEKGYEYFLNGQSTLKVDKDILNSIHEKFLAQENAADALDDLDRQEAERRRIIFQEEIINNIELIRSKKLGADEEIEILKQQIADEGQQLEIRRELYEQLQQKQNEGFEVMINELTKFGVSYEEIQSLINEKDQVILANRLKELRATKLSQAATDEFAKVILQVQDSRIEYAKQKAKFDEDEIKRQQKLLQLEKETIIIERQTNLTELQAYEQQRQEILDKSNQDILQSNNVFNKDMLSMRQAQADAQIEIARAQAVTQEELLAAQYEIDKQNIQNTIQDEFLQKAELDKLEAKYNQDKYKLQVDYFNKVDDLQQKEIEQQRQLDIRRTEVLIENISKVTQALSDEIDSRFEKEQNASNAQLSRTEANIEKQRDLANKGLANTLAFQEELLAKQQLAAQDLERRNAKQKEQIQVAEALLNAYNAELKQPNANPQIAAIKAIQDVLLFKGLAKGIVQFAADGENRVEGPGTRTSDSIPFMLSKDEGVVKADANMGNPGVVAALNADKFDQMYMPRVNVPAEYRTISNTADNIASSLMIQTNKEIISILNDIKNKPVHRTEFDNFGNVIDKVYHSGKTETIKYLSRSRRKLG